MTEASNGEIHRKVQKALKVGGDTHTVDDIVDAVNSEYMQLWENGESIVVTEITTFPRYRVVNIVLVAGNIDEVMALQVDIEEFARKENCVALRMQGRKGWERVLPHYGWKADPKVLFEKPITIQEVHYG
jgi:hypothetical protein